MTLSVADRLALSELVHRYAACVDARQPDDVAALFTPTAQLSVPKPPDHLDPAVRHRGRTEIRAALDSLSGVVRTHHAIVGEVYIGGATAATATGAIAGVAHHWTEHDGQVSDTVWYLHYTDEYRHTDSGWRIALRALSIDAIEVRPARQVQH